MPFRKNNKGVSVNVRLTPAARREECAGVVDAGEGKLALKISVRAVPEDGRANKALIEFLASEWKLPKSAISLLAGAGSRQKTLQVEGDSDSLLRHLEDWRNKLG